MKKILPVFRFSRMYCLIQSLKLKSDSEFKIFTFDNILDQSATQEQVFELFGQQIIENILNGYHVAVFAYG